MFISHDLSVVEHLCTKIGIMYLGTIVETAPRDELFTNPLHPYTKALLSAVPIPDPTVKRERIILEGDIPSPANPPSGCCFHTRCPFATDICKQTGNSVMLVKSTLLLVIMYKEKDSFRN